MTETPGLKATNVVLVRGGFVDGSGWEGVYKILTKDGYTVSVVQNPTTSLADDVAASKRMPTSYVSRLITRTVIPKRIMRSKRNQIC